MLKLRDFLLDILANSNKGIETSATITSGKITSTYIAFSSKRFIILTKFSSLGGTKQKRGKCSDPFSGPRSVYNLMKCFTCMRNSAEQNSRLLETPEIDDYRGELLYRWNSLTKWIDAHTLELQEFNTLTDRIQDLSAKANALSQVANKLAKPDSPKRSQVRRAVSFMIQWLIFTVLFV